MYDKESIVSMSNFNLVLQTLHVLSSPEFKNNVFSDWSVHVYAFFIYICNLKKTITASRQQKDHCWF